METVIIIFCVYLAICVLGTVYGYMNRESTDAYFWIGILLYLIQMFGMGYLFLFKLPNDIAEDKPAACSPSPGTEPVDDNSTKFFINQIDKCHIDLSPSIKIGLKRLFWLLGAFILVIEIIILLLLFPWAREKANKAKGGVGSAGKKAAESARKAKSAMFDKVDPDA